MALNRKKVTKNLNSFEIWGYMYTCLALAPQEHHE
jgi:hypothetical protein